MKLSIKLSRIALIIAGALFFAGCEKQTPTVPYDLNRNYDSASEIMGAVTSDSNENNMNSETGGNWPLIASKTYTYNDSLGGYNGGKIEFGINNKSSFHIKDRALIPPAGPSMSPRMRDATVTMRIDYDPVAGQLLYEFGPHGCQFQPCAMLKMDYGELQIEEPVLFYIDERGNYIKMEPHQINTNQKWIMIKLDHFSRYAVSVSR